MKYKETFYGSNTSLSEDTALVNETIVLMSAEIVNSLCKGYKFARPLKENRYAFMGDNSVKINYHVLKRGLL